MARESGWCWEVCAPPLLRDLLELGSSSSESPSLLLLLYPCNRCQGGEFVNPNWFNRASVGHLCRERAQARNRGLIACRGTAPLFPHLPVLGLLLRLRH